MVIIRLLLKRDIAIGIAREEQAQEPLQEIAYIERDVKHLPHLGRMDFFVIERSRRKLRSLPAYKEYPKKIHSGKSPKRDIGITNNTHTQPSLSHPRDKGTASPRPIRVSSGIAKQITS